MEEHERWTEVTRKQETGRERDVPFRTWQQDPTLPIYNPAHIQQATRKKEKQEQITNLPPYCEVTVGMTV